MVNNRGGSRWKKGEQWEIINIHDNGNITIRCETTWSWVCKASDFILVNTFKIGDKVTLNTSSQFYHQLDAWENWEWVIIKIIKNTSCPYKIKSWGYYNWYGEEDLILIDKKENSMNPEIEQDVPNETEEQVEQNIEIFSTTEWEYIVKLSDGKGFYLDKNGKQIPAIEWEPSKKVRSDSKIYKEVEDKLKEEAKMKAERIEVDNINGFQVFLDKATLSLKIDVNWEVMDLDKVKASELKASHKKLEKLKINVKTKAIETKLWDRVLLFWPTGTGKTFEFLATVEEMKKQWNLDAFDIVTITEWVEDVDFLAHIVPTEKGIKYSEKNVVTLLREAANGKKVAILLDELNRWWKSFLNLILKLLDAVDGESYILDNYLNDEKIIIPQENVLFFATMNLWGKYTGTNSLDEALFDRFNRVNYKGYSVDVEKEMFKWFAGFEKQASEIVKYVRGLHADAEIRAPISTRWVKMWAEAFINTGKSKEDLINTFRDVLLNRLTSVDDYGNPNKEEEGLILRKFKDLGLI